MDKALVILLALALAGCATNSGGIPCTAGPILLDEDDELTRGTEEQVVALNNAGETICHWQAPGGPG